MTDRQMRDDHAVLHMRLEMLEGRIDGLETAEREMRRWMTGNGDGPGLMEQVRAMQRSLRIVLWLTVISAASSLTIAGLDHSGILHAIAQALRVGVGP